MKWGNSHGGMCNLDFCSLLGSVTSHYESHDCLYTNQISLIQCYILNNHIHFCDIIHVVLSCSKSFVSVKSEVNVMFLIL